MNKELKINFAAIALAQSQMNNLANSIREEIVIPTPNSKGEFVTELQETVNSLNQFRLQLVDVIEKTSSALNNSIISFKQMDEGISYKS